MGAKVKGRRLGDWAPEIKEALATGLTKHVTLTQTALAKDSPKDTGRFASSWFVLPDSPGTETRPEGWNPVGIRNGGTAKVETERYTGVFMIDKKYFIYNNLPYANRVALDPRWSKGGAGGAAWFRTIQTQNDRLLNQRLNKELKRVL
jgi:hypothetical protein